MNPAEIVILVLLAAGVAAAVRRALKHGACGECSACGTCKACAKGGCAFCPGHKDGSCPACRGGAHGGGPAGAPPPAEGD
jgi:hypothetical protein